MEGGVTWQDFGSVVALLVALAGAIVAALRGFSKLEHSLDQTKSEITGTIHKADRTNIEQHANLAAHIGEVHSELKGNAADVRDLHEWKTGFEHYMPEWANPRAAAHWAADHQKRHDSDGAAIVDHSKAISEHAAKLADHSRRIQAIADGHKRLTPTDGDG